MELISFSTITQNLLELAEYFLTLIFLPISTLTHLHTYISQRCEMEYAKFLPCTDTFPLFLFVSWYNVIQCETKPNTNHTRNLGPNAKFLEDKGREKLAKSNPARWLGKCSDAVRNLMHTITHF